MLPLKRAETQRAKKPKNLKIQIKYENRLTAQGASNKEGDKDEWHPIKDEVDAGQKDNILATRAVLSFIWNIPHTGLFYFREGEKARDKTSFRICRQVLEDTQSLAEAKRRARRDHHFNHLALNDLPWSPKL